MPRDPMASALSSHGSWRSRSHAGPRQICGFAQLGLTDMPATSEPAVVVEQLVKVYKTTRAVDGISFALEAGSVTGLRGQRRRKDHHHRHDYGSRHAHLGLREGARGGDAAPALSRPARDEFREPLCRHAASADGGKTSKCSGAYAVEDLNGRIAALAEELDLVEFLDRPTGKLSAGQKTRVALAKALINPRVLLLDEPTASLDPDTADWVRSHLERFRRAATVLLASHNMGEVERLCERVIIMKRGASRMTTRRSGSWSATAARRSRRCSSTSRAGGEAREAAQ